MTCLTTMICGNSNNPIVEIIPVSNINHKMNFYGNFYQNSNGRQPNMLNEVYNANNNDHDHDNNSPFQSFNDYFFGKKR